MNIFKGVKDEITVRCEAVLLQDGGKELRVPFRGRFRKLGTSAAEELLAQMEAATTTKSDIIRQHLVSWSELPHVDGGEIVYGLFSDISASDPDR